jgi:hypothetical protein
MKTRKHVKQLAVLMVNENGLINLSCSALCTRAEISNGSWLHIMGCTFTEFIAELRHENIETKVHQSVIRTRANPELRREHLLNTAIILATRTGVHRLYQKDVANEAGVSMGLITKYFGTMKKLRRTVMRAGIQREILPIIMFGIVNGDPIVRKISTELRTRAIECLKC